MSKGREHHQTHQGEIIFGRSTLACEISNLSASGARVNVAGANELPQEFDLSITLTQTKHYCAVVKRKASYVRVVFV